MKTKLTHLIGIVTIGLCANLAHASNYPPQCSLETFKKIADLQGDMRVQIANRDPDEVMKLQLQLIKMPNECHDYVKKNTGHTREEILAEIKNRLKNRTK
ncbi:MAG: hypothetical protein J0H87_02050 [Holosporales bacterium]|nr:hypothetical protein [Holosporales bacterium]